MVQEKEWQREHIKDATSIRSFWKHRNTKNATVHGNAREGKGGEENPYSINSISSLIQLRIIYWVH